MKKDLATIGKYFPTGQFKLVSVDVEGAKISNQTLIAGASAYSINLLKTELGISVAKHISDEFIKKEKEEGSIKSKKFLNKLIKDGLENGRKYKFSDFKYYQNDNVSPENELSGLPLSFISKVYKEFKDVGTDSDITYIYVDNETKVIVGDKEETRINTYVIGYKELDGSILFIGGTISMPRQISLLD